MNNIFNLIKKEFDKIFKSPRAILTNFILPGLLIYIIYSAMGGFISVGKNDLQKNDYKIAVVNHSTAFSTAFDNFNNLLEQTGKDKLKFNFVSVDINIDDFTRIINYENLDNPTEDETKIYNNILNSINNGDYDVWLCFNKDFDQKYSLNNVNNKAIVGVFGKVTIDKSSFALSTINNVLDSMQNKIIANIPVDFSTESDMTRTIFASMIPLFLMIFILSGGMSICADSIAGEKERGTISTLLMTPIKRSHIIYGKIISLVIITVIAAIGPFLAIILSMPTLMQGSNINFSAGIGLSAGGIMQLFLLVLLTALLSTSIFLVFSTIAKSVKEASVYSSSIYMIVIILITITTTIKIGNNLGFYFVPFMNIALGLNGIITGALTSAQLLCIVFSTLLYCAIFIVLAIKLFNSERVMFSK